MRFQHTHFLSDEQQELISDSRSDTEKTTILPHLGTLHNGVLRVDPGKLSSLSGTYSATLSVVDNIAGKLSDIDTGLDYPERSTSYRSFAPEGESVAMDDMDNAEDNLQILLEQHEKQLAVDYGFADFNTDVQDIDSVEVFQETNNRAVGGDESSAKSLEKLHELFHLRSGDWSNRDPRCPKLQKFTGPPPPVTGTPHHIDASRFWAVVIGIDEYNMYPLRGCVADAILMNEYLRNDLKVPKERIQKLFGTQRTSPHDLLYPSRYNIIRTLYGLIKKPEIEKGDNIVIYFAGHGTSYKCTYCSKDLTVGNLTSSNARIPQAGYFAKPNLVPGMKHIETFCPIEALCPIDRNTIDSNGFLVPDISDREFNTILSEIAAVKGDRITVILDCCHSASINRAAEPGTRLAPPLPEQSRDLMLDVGIKKLQEISSRTSLKDPHWRPDLSSHVALAACREWEVATETEYVKGFHGVFTVSLIRTLRSGLWKKELTYAELVRNLRERLRQIPVASGSHKGERLWYQTN